MRNLLELILSIPSEFAKSHFFLLLFSCESGNPIAAFLVEKGFDLLPIRIHRAVRFFFETMMLSPSSNLAFNSLFFLV